MELKQELKLKQTLSQKMIQSANILQMGQIELKEYIEEMALENPVVDLEEREPENGRLEENGELNEKISSNDVSDKTNGRGTCRFFMLLLLQYPDA